jgi:hypothetical protein
VNIRTQIRDAVITLLNTDRPDGIPEATRRRYIPGRYDDDMRIAVFFHREVPERIGGRGGPLTKRTLHLAVVPIVAVEDPAEADDAAEPALEWIVSRLGNTNLGGLAHDIEEGAGGEGTSWTALQSNLLWLAVPTLWRIEYQTLRDDLTRKQ